MTSKFVKNIPMHVVFSTPSGDETLRLMLDTLTRKNERTFQGMNLNRREKLDLEVVLKTLQHKKQALLLGVVEKSGQDYWGVFRSMDRTASTSEKVTWDWQEKQCPLRDVDTSLLMFNLVHFCTRFYKIRPSSDQVQLIFFPPIWLICHHGSVTHLQKGSMNLDVNKVVLK